MELQTNKGADRRRTHRERSWEITELWDRHQEIIRRLFLGQSARDIAKDLGIAENTISQIRNSELGQRALADLHAAANDNAINVAQRIRSIAPKAIDVLEGMLDYQREVGYELPSDRKNAASIAFGVLDRAGHAPVHKNVNVEVPVSGSIISEIKERAMKAGAIAKPKTEQETEDAQEIDYTEEEN